MHAVGISLDEIQLAKLDFLQVPKKQRSSRIIYTMSIFFINHGQFY